MRRVTCIGVCFLACLTVHPAFGQELVQTLKGHKRAVYSVLFSPDGKTLASADKSTIKLWDLETGIAKRTLPGFALYPSPTLRPFVFSPDGKTLAAGAESKDRYWVTLWEVQSGKKLRRFFLKEANVCCPAFLPDGKTLATITATLFDFDKDVEPVITLQSWDVRTGNAKQTVKLLAGFGDVAFSPDGTSLACTNIEREGEVAIWNVNTGKRKQTLDYTVDKLITLAFSPNCRLLAVAYDEIELRAVGTGQLRLRLDVKANRVIGLAFSPDGKLIASAGNRIRIWEVDTGIEMVSLRGDTWRIYSVAFSPDGKTLASAGDDKTVELWDVSKLLKQKKTD